jgi:hypothetical protein
MSAISMESLSMRRQQVCVLDLIKKKNWLPHRIGMHDTQGYQQRMTWLRETLGESFNEFENLDLSSDYRWCSAPSTSAQGLVDSVLLAFKEDADRTMFVLRWT